MQEYPPPHPSPLDKDKKIKIMDELIKTNQKHIEHLKQTINQLKKVNTIPITQQLQFEQKRNQDIEKDNGQLKDQIKRLLLKPILHTQSTQTTLDIVRKDSKQSSIIKDDISQNNSATKQKPECPPLAPKKDPIVAQISPSKPEFKKKMDIKIDINQALKRQQSGPISSVIKSSTYLHGLTDAKLIDAIKERIPEKTYRNGMYSSDKISKNRTLIFSFQNKSTVFDQQANDDCEIQQRNSEGKQNFFESIIEEQRADTMEISALQLPTYKLFEKFYIMGCEKKEFMEFDNDPTIKEGILPASILFKNDSTKEVPIYESILNGFVYPFGNRVERIKVNDSFRKLKEIMYSGNKHELLDKFSIFTIKNQDDDREDLPDHTNEVLLNQSNPEKLLYGICLSVYDYIETTPDNIELTYKNRKKRIFWKYKKTYCFLTYFPFYELFQDLLISIISNHLCNIDLIKINRTDRYLKKYSEEYEVLKDVDGQQIILEFQEELTTFLKLINEIKPQQGHQLLEIQTLAGTLKYKLPNQLQLDIELRLWSANVALQIVNYREILTIFLAIMSEISVIFVCEKNNMLTFVIHFFHHLIRPAEWTHPIIYNVPEQLLTMMQSPVPIIVGVNLSENEFHLSGLSNDCENCLFVFLDRDRDKENKMAPKPQNLLNEISVPYFNGTLTQIEQLLRSSNAARNPSPGIRQNQNKQDDKKIVKFYFDEADQIKSKRVLELFKKIIYEYIIALLPPSTEEGIKNQNDVNFLLIERIIVSKSEPRDKKFIENICKTQYFQYFLQEHYNQS